MKKLRKFNIDFYDKNLDIRSETAFTFQNKADFVQRLKPKICSKKTIAFQVIEENF